MRELNECEAEVFRRSEKRIKQRQRTRNRVLSLCIPLCLVAILSVIMYTEHNKAGNAEEMYEEERNKENNVEKMYGEERDKENNAVGMYAENTKINNAEEFQRDNPSDECEMNERETELEEFGSIDSFSFSLTWDCYGISSYNSQTGKLVKTTDATNPEDYITTYELTTEQKQEIYDLIYNLNVTDYPDIYNPHTNGMMSEPSMTLILSVNTDTVQKTITAADIALTYQSDNREGQEFLNVCKAIEDILTSTEEWKALPEYEFFYE